MYTVKFFDSDGIWYSTSEARRYAGIRIEIENHITRFGIMNARFIVGYNGSDISLNRNFLEYIGEYEPEYFQLMKYLQFDKEATK